MYKLDEEIARRALDLPAKIAGLEIESEEIALYHLLRSLLAFCEREHVDFDDVYSHACEDRLVETGNMPSPALRVRWFKREGKWLWHSITAIRAAR